MGILIMMTIDKRHNGKLLSKRIYIFPEIKTLGNSIQFFIIAVIGKKHLFKDLSIYYIEYKKIRFLKIFF